MTILLYYLRFPFFDAPQLTLEFIKLETESFYFFVISNFQPTPNPRGLAP